MSDLMLSRAASVPDYWVGHLVSIAGSPPVLLAGIESHPTNKRVIFTLMDADGVRTVDVHDGTAVAVDALVGARIEGEA